MIQPIEEPFVEWCRRVAGNDTHVILDTETTDKYGEVIEIAIADVQGRRLYNKLIRPMGAITQGATEIHHITPEMVANAPTLLEEWYEICQIVAGRTVITYNAKFDSERIFRSQIKRKIQLCPDCQWTYECAMLGYAEWWNAPPRWEGAGPAWQKLGEACSQQKIELPPGLHRAMADTEATLALIRRVAEVGESSPRCYNDPD